MIKAWHSGPLRLALGLPGALLVLIGILPCRAESVVEPSGYRMEDYRSPTPGTLEGIPALTTSAAEAAWRAGSSVFVDVLPRPPKPANLAPGTIWRDSVHNSVPGAIWLPNVGFGGLSPDTEAYFDRGLAAATAGNRAKPLVFFCERQCWMSWNAAKRAQAMGFRNVSWFSEGTTGWSEAGFPLAPLEPWRDTQSTSKGVGKDGTSGLLDPAARHPDIVKSPGEPP